MSAIACSVTECNAVCGGLINLKKDPQNAVYFLQFLKILLLHSKTKQIL
jgi:hypothetical protein